jgi:tight adherence protein B
MSLSSLPPEVLFGVLGVLVVLAVVFLVRGLRPSRTPPPPPVPLTREDGDESGILERSGDSGVFGRGESGVLVKGAEVTLTPAELPNGAFDRFDRWFERAVRWSGLGASPTGAVALMCLLAVAFAAALHLWQERNWLTIAGGLLGLMLPLIAIAILQGRHRRTLQNQLPDALYLMSSALRAGQTIEQAIEMYAQRGNKPLADEFQYTAGLIRLGWSPTAALQATAPRVGLLDFNLLASTVGLYAQTGGNLALMMDRLAVSVRDRNHFRGQFAAQTAQARVVAIFLGGAAPVFLIGYALFEPEYVQSFFESTRGWLIVAGCLLMEVIGVIWVWKLLKIDY